MVLKLEKKTEEIHIKNVMEIMTDNYLKFYKKQILDEMESYFTTCNSFHLYLLWKKTPLISRHHRMFHEVKMFSFLDRSSPVLSTNLARFCRLI